MNIGYGYINSYKIVSNLLKIMSLLTKSASIVNVLQSTNSISYSRSIFNYLPPCVAINQVRNYAARKGTRERRKKLKVKVQEEVKTFIPHNLRQRDKLLLSRPSRKYDDSWKKLPIDDVYAYKFYQWKMFDFISAVEGHRETHHPEMYNQPSAPLLLTVELNMSTEKKTKFVENFSDLVGVPHKFDHGEERALIAFSKEPEMVKEALEAGAQLAGGVELVKEFQSGNLSMHDFQFVLAHPNILPELVVLRGLMKKKFPNIKNGTLEVNLAEAVEKFKTGVQYKAVKDEYEKDFGIVETVLGTLDMDSKHLEANFAAILNSINSFRPKRQDNFIRRCLLLSPPSREKFKVDHSQYLVEDKTRKTTEKVDVTEEVKEEVQAVG